MRSYTYKLCFGQAYVRVQASVCVSANNPRRLRAASNVWLRHRVTNENV